MMQGGSEALLKTLNRLYRDLVTPTVQANKGRVVKLMGDGALIEFTSAGPSARVRHRYPGAFARSGSSIEDTGSILLRAGLHVGDVTVEGDDISGDGDQHRRAAAGGGRAGRCTRLKGALRLGGR